MSDPKPKTKLPWINQDGMVRSQDGEAIGAYDADVAYLTFAANSLPALQAENEALKEIIRSVNDQIVGYDDYHTVEVGFIRKALGEPT